MTPAPAVAEKNINVAMATFELGSLTHHKNKFSRGLAAKYKKCHGA